MPLSSPLRLSLAVAFAVHFVVAACWWWVSPKGFAVDNCRFWLNSIFPLIVMAAAGYGWLNLQRKRVDQVTMASLLFAAGWLGLAAAGKALFPISLAGFWELALVIAVLGFGFAWLSVHQFPRLTGKLILLNVLSFLIGIFVVWAQVPASPSTRPINEMPPVVLDHPLAGRKTVLEFGEHFRFDPNVPLLAIQREGITIDCYPLLRFFRPSPAGFWSLLAPRDRSNTRRLMRASEADGGSQFHYSDSTAVQLRSEDGTLYWSSWSPVTKDIYTHLNSYCMMIVRGRQDLRIRFSPCPLATIDVLPSDYPTGRPARFAYLSEQSEFKVVEASSGEKGPFNTLATGTLLRGAPLSIDLLDGDKLIARWTLEDWTEQLSTDSSPTAGWGVPQNAVEFRRTGEAANSSVEIYVTLAATSVGRGYETVGHRAGTYRNAMSFQLVPEKAVP